MTTIGQRIIEVRAEKGWTVRHLAEKVGVVHSSVVGWESGDSTPRGANLFKLANALDASVVWLRTGQGSKKLEDHAPADVVYEAIRPYAPISKDGTPVPISEGLLNLVIAAGEAVRDYLDEKHITLTHDAKPRLIRLVVQQCRDTNQVPTPAVVSATFLEMLQG